MNSTEMLQTWKKMIVAIAVVGMAAMTLHAEGGDWPITPRDLDGKKFVWHPDSSDCSARATVRPKTVTVRRFIFEGQEQIIFGVPHTNNYEQQLYFNQRENKYYNETNTRLLVFINANFARYSEDGKALGCAEVQR